MKLSIWMLTLALGLAACGGGTATETSLAADGDGGLELSGLSLEVHQAPD
jgi:hypothetical protein